MPGKVEERRTDVASTARVQPRQPRLAEGCRAGLGRDRASPSASRHDSDRLDDEAHQLTALAEVCFGPQAPGVGVQDDPLLALAIDLGVETFDFPLQPGPDRAVPALADGASHVELVVKGLQAVLG